MGEKVAPKEGAVQSVAPTLDAEPPKTAAMTVEILSGTVVALVGGAGIVLSAGDNALAFASAVNWFELQNNTSAPLRIEYDAGATAGSFLIPAGATYSQYILFTTLHIFAIGAAVVNGSAAGGIVLKGRA